jgi:hypothetical protein
MKLACVSAVAAALLLGSAAVAAKPKPSESPLLRGLAQCRGLTDDTARLRCFDAAAAALTDAAGSGKVVVVEREDVRRVRRSLFGFSLPRVPFFSGDDTAEDAQEEITAKIAAAGPIGYDKYQIRLEDGALWQTTEGSSAIDVPRAGDTVVIKRGPLGGYLMKIAGQRGVKAKRVG